MAQNGILTSLFDACNPKITKPLPIIGLKFFTTNKKTRTSIIINHYK